MIGGDTDAVARLDPVFRTLTPGVVAATRSPGRSVEPGTEERGYLHCGPSAAGHFTKMVHNGIEYGVMAAYAEGLNLFGGVWTGWVSALTCGNVWNVAASSGLVDWIR